MKKAMIRLLLGLVILMLASGPVLAEEKGNKQQGRKFFQDEEDAAWAKQHMAAGNLRGLLKGDPDGKFRPNDYLNRVELITAAVRFANMEDQAKSWKGGNLPFDDRTNIAQQYNWGMGYIGQAVKAGWLANAGMFNPGRDADRLWAAEVLVKALGLEEEAQAKMGMELDFQDLPDIPEDKIGYLAVATERGILTGYPDGTFKPKNSLTRAELATLLNRADDQKAWLASYEVRGTVKNVVYAAINGSQASISLDVDRDLPFGEKLLSGAYEVSPDALVLINGQNADLDDIKEGYKAQLQLNSLNTVVIVNARIPKEEQVKLSLHRGWVVQLPNVDGQRAYGLIAGLSLGNDKNKIKKMPKAVEEARFSEYRVMVLLPKDSDIESKLYANLGNLVAIQGQNQKSPGILRRPAYKVYDVQLIARSSD